jgi:malic enzyme
VAQPRLEIRTKPALSFELTNRANSVAILTNGSRVLGLRDLGPAAAMPVMEGKALHELTVEPASGSLRPLVLVGQGRVQQV